jgi:NAD(P)-dependent dehydrogenase (short-subunit alcohol dehydrogenase family)
MTDEVVAAAVRDMAGLRAIVTGGGSGIGSATARRLLMEGAEVACLDLEPSGSPEGCLQVHGDVSDASVAEAVRETVERLGGLDVLVNNAGFVRDRMVFTTSEEEWDAVIRVHLKGHFASMRHACDFWRARSKAGESVDARIINTSSGAGLMGSVGQGAYSAAKAGIAALTLVEAAELARYGVTANAIAPAARTRMTEEVFADRMQAPAEGFDVNDPANISPLVVWLGSAESRAVTGRVFEVEGGMLSVADGWQHGAVIDKGDRWAPSDIGAAVKELLAQAPAPAPVYGAQ